MPPKNGPDIGISISASIKDRSYAYVNVRFNLTQILMLMSLVTNLRTRFLRFPIFGFRDVRTEMLLMLLLSVGILSV